MFKNVQLKIILIFTIIGLLLIMSFGIVWALNLQGVEQDMIREAPEKAGLYHEIISNQIEQAKIVTVILIIVYGTITTLIGIFVSKVIIDPISRLIDRAPRIVAGEDININEGKKNNQTDELTNAFNMMTNELRENLNEVNRQKRQIETILLHMTDGIIAFDMEGKIMYINPAATDLMSLGSEDNTFEKIFGKLNIDINLEKTIYLEDWTSYEQRVQVNDRFLNILFATFKDENERPSGMMVVIQDITEHVKLDNLRKEFVADVSHELKTPITSIMGYADTLLEGEYDKETQYRFLNVIAGEARRMAKLVTDLLVLSRYDSNKVKKEITEFDLGDLVKKCQEKVQLEINKKGHEVECFVTANVPPVKADKDGIERVVLNILTNSIKYTPDNGNIKIYVGFVYNDAYIKVIDNGIGIPEEDLNRIFDRFYRVDKARTREMGGTGLGLSIAKEILDQNNGSIDIKSEKGKGTEVVIRIPTK